MSDAITKDNNANGRDGSDFKNSKKNSFSNKEDETYLDNFENELNKNGSEMLETIQKSLPEGYKTYKNKKLVSNGMMNLTLLMVNANQLETAILNFDKSAHNILLIIFISISIILQILVCIAILLSTRYCVTNEDQRKMSFKLGNFIIVGTFLITAMNIFVTIFQNK